MWNFIRSFCKVHLNKIRLYVIIIITLIHVQVIATGRLHLKPCCKSYRILLS